MFKRSNVQIFKYSNIQYLNIQRLNVQMFHFQMFKRLNIQFSNAQMFNVQTFKCSRRCGFNTKDKSCPSGIPGYPGIPGLKSNPDPDFLEFIILKKTIILKTFISVGTNLFQKIPACKF